MTMSLLNKKAVKNLALFFAEQLRPSAGFTRVSSEFINAVESLVRNAIRDRVFSHPSRGKTLT